MPVSLKGFRRRVGAFIGGFEAGLSNRRLRGFQPSRAHLNTLIAAAGPDITARARWLVRNNGYAANAIESWAGNVVGAGINVSFENVRRGAQALRATGVVPRAVATSSFRITWMVPRDVLDESVRSLHRTFLEQPAPPVP